MPVTADQLNKHYVGVSSVKDPERVSNTIRAVQSAGLAGQKPGGPGFLLPDRFEPTGPAKAGPAKKSRAGKNKPARHEKYRPGKSEPAGSGKGRLCSL